MSMTSRDRKVLAVLLAVGILLGYWFLLLAPKREQAATAAAEVATQEQRLQAVQAQLMTLTAAKATYAEDYTAIVRLGKAIPSSVDTPSLLIQLQEAADGSKIDFSSFKAGTRTVAAPAPESLGKQAADANAEQGVVPAGGTETAPTSEATAAVEAGREDTPAARKAAREQAGASAGTAPPGLEAVPLEFAFAGSFFDLADFFHELKRFVRVSGNDIDVSGRLMTIDGLKFGESESLTDITATVSATAYVSPKAQGATGGATPAGPPETVPAGTAPTTPPSTPTASVTP
ncbi:MAG: type 4a pilus biogenesis protein PilO [Thermoleophilaceae bacterium]|nr:type 4a pilus biogenesis protein PilO [Thermoleophilaceae bacterium]